MTSLARLGRIGALALVLSAGGIGAAQADFGAIAFSPQTGAHGYSYSAGTRAQAERLAMKNCRSYGPGCRVLTYFQNACGALAVGDGNGYGFAWAAERGAAERSALRQCRGQTSGCSVVRWSCSG